MLYLTFTTITSVDLAHYRVSRAKDWVSVNCGTIYSIYSTVNHVGKIQLSPMFSNDSVLPTNP